MNSEDDFDFGQAVNFECEFILNGAHCIVCHTVFRKFHINPKNRMSMIYIQLESIISSRDLNASVATSN